MVYYLLFNFVVFLTSFFLVYLSIVFKKFLKFLCSFIVWIRHLIKKFCKTMVLKILSENSRKFLIKKNRDIVNTKIFQNSIGYYMLFNFVVFLTSFFLVYLFMVFKKFLKVLCCFIVWIRDFIKKIVKLWFFFQKKLRYLKSIISTKFRRLLFILYLFLSFLAFFFLFYLSKLVKKLWKFL